MPAADTYIKRRTYPSDITDAQWACISPLLNHPSQNKRGRKRETNLREVINAINYRWSTGCAWRMLPHDLPSWNTIYTYFRCWEQEGTLKKLRDVLINKKQSPYIDFSPGRFSPTVTPEPNPSNSPDWNPAKSSPANHLTRVYPK